MSAFEDFVNLELPKRPATDETGTLPAGSYRRNTGVGKLTESRTPAQVLSDIGGASITHASKHTDGTDDIQDATAAQKGLATAAQISKLDGIEAGANNYSHPNHTGDVTSVGDGATTIVPDAVTYDKMQDVSAADKLLGSIAGGTVEEIACTAAGRALLDDADAAAQRTTLGLGDIATKSTPLPVANGGTGNMAFAGGELIRADAIGTSLESSGKDAPTGDIVGTTDTQTLSAKTLTTPTVTNLSNMTHDHADAPGGGQLNATSAFNAGTMPMARLPDKLKKRTLKFHIKNPTVGNYYMIDMSHMDVPYKITEVGAITDAGTCDINLDSRAFASVSTPGSSILSSDLQAPTGGLTTNTFSGSLDDIAGNRWLFLEIAAVSSANDVWGYVEYTVDD